MLPQIVQRVNRRYSRRYQGQRRVAPALQIPDAVPRLSRRANGRAIPVDDLVTRPGTKQAKRPPTEIELMWEVQIRQPEPSQGEIQLPARPPTERSCQPIEQAGLIGDLDHDHAFLAQMPRSALQHPGRIRQMFQDIHKADDRVRRAIAHYRGEGSRRDVQPCGPRFLGRARRRFHAIPVESGGPHTLQQPPERATHIKPTTALDDAGHARQELVVGSHARRLHRAGVHFSVQPGEVIAVRLPLRGIDRELDTAPAAALDAHLVVAGSDVPSVRALAQVTEMTGSGSHGVAGRKRITASATFRRV